MKVTFAMLTVCVVASLIGCANHDKKDEDKSLTDTTLTDAQYFKAEFEDVNGTKSKKGNTFISIDIDTNNSVVYVDEEDVLNTKNGIVLFGFPTCPWCRNTIEPLLEFAKEEKVPIYYLNISAIRDKKEKKEDGTIVTTEEGTKGYQLILKKFDKLLDPYKELGSDSIKRIVSSTVLFIKDDKGFEKKSGTVETQTDPYVKLTKQQHNELKQVYKDIFVRYNKESN